jgi:hypothetical protein
MQLINFQHQFLSLVRMRWNSHTFSSASMPRSETTIRTISERYGRNWCWDNGVAALKEMAAFRTERKPGELQLRVYSRPTNSVRIVPFTDLLERIMNLEGGGAQREHHPLPTRFGQIPVVDDMHVSTSIFDWVVLRFREM